MKRIIREYAPFIMLGYSFLFAVLSYFDALYEPLYPYLSQSLGFSLFTNAFMYSVYMNKKYCTATKICVLGLVVLNLFNIMYYAVNIDGLIYDIYLTIIISVVLLLKKYI